MYYKHEQFGIVKYVCEHNEFRIFVDTVGTYIEVSKHCLSSKRIYKCVDQEASKDWFEQHKTF